MPPAPSSRLQFQAWNFALRPDFAVLARNPDVVRYIPPGTPYSDERIDEFLLRQQGFEASHGHSLWWLGARKPTAQGIGFCGIQPVAATGEVEIGWWLRPDQQGQGYASEAARSVLSWAWQETTLDRIIAVTLPENEPSWRVMERLGMRRVGQFAAADRGLPHLDLDLLVYEVLRSASDQSAT